MNDETGVLFASVYDAIKSGRWDQHLVWLSARVSHRMASNEWQRQFSTVSEPHSAAMEAS